MAPGHSTGRKKNSQYPCRGSRARGNRMAAVLPPKPLSLCRHFAPMAGRFQKHSLRFEVPGGLRLFLAFGRLLSKAVGSGRHVCASLGERYEL